MDEIDKQLMAMSIEVCIDHVSYLKENLASEKYRKLLAAPDSDVLVKCNDISLGHVLFHLDQMVELLKRS